MKSLVPVVCAVALVAVGCGTNGGAGAADTGQPQEPKTITTAPAGAQQLHPDVVSATIARQNDGSLRFDVTMSSPYDTAERYADAWRILGPDGALYGVRELLHDHGGEQPFTRSLTGVVIPDGVELVTIEGRDQINGWGGATVEVAIPPLSGG